MKSYCSSFAVSKSLLALVLSRQGFISIDFEWAFLRLKSIIDQITQFTCKSAKFEAFIAAMHWHRSKSTFLLEQFLNSEKSNQEQMWCWGHLLWSCLLLSHNRSPPSGLFRSWVWLDFNKNLKPFLFFWKRRQLTLSEAKHRSQYPLGTWTGCWAILKVGWITPCYQHTWYL